MLCNYISLPIVPNSYNGPYFLLKTVYYICVNVPLCYFKESTHSQDKENIPPPDLNPAAKVKVYSLFLFCVGNKKKWIKYPHIFRQFN